MQKPIWLFGGIAGVLCALVEFWFYSGVGNEAAQVRVMIMLKMAILVICIVFGLILIRKLLGGTISLARTILSGTLIALVRSVIMIIAFLVLYSPNGEFYKSYQEEAVEMAKVKIDDDEDVKPDEKEQRIEEAEQTILAQFKPVGYAKFAVGASIMTGLVISVLMAAFIGTNMMYKDNGEIRK